MNDIPVDTQYIYFVYGPSFSAVPVTFIVVAVVVVVVLSVL